MDKPTTIMVSEVVGSSICVACDEGQSVFERTVTEICSGRSVSLSFENVTELSPAFLNTAIGQLYGSFDEQEIRDRLRVTYISPDDLDLLHWVVKTAKRYLKDPQRFNRVADEVMGRI